MTKMGVRILSIAGLLSYTSTVIAFTNSGIPSAPKALSLTPTSLSISVAWRPPSGYHGNISYQVVYYGRDAVINTVNVTNGTVCKITGLKPFRRYAVKVRAFSETGMGPFSSAQRTATERLPIVQNVRVSEYLDSNSIRVSWSMAATLEREEVDHYKIYHSTYSTNKQRAQREIFKIVSATKSSEVFQLPSSDPDMEFWFEVTVSVRVKGEEFQSERSQKLIFRFDARFFQLRIKPVRDCISWEENETDFMEQSIHKAIAEAVSDRCNCTFTSKFLRTGEFRCWNAPNEVAYRSSIVATPSYASSHILSFIESWVRSKVAVVRKGKIVHRVVSDACAVGVASLDAEDCVVEETEEHN